MATPALAEDKLRLPKSTYETKMAFIVGYTGEVGKEVVRELLGRKVFQKLILVGRRKTSESGNQDTQVEHRVIDFDKLEEHKAAFADCGVGFCCLGTTRSKSGADEFVKVDHDYVVNVAKIAHAQGCQHFSVVSSVGANKNSLFLYTKTKGLMEEHVSEIGLQKLSIFRPGFLQCDRQERRFTECVTSVVMKPIMWAKPTLLSVPTTIVAKAMVNDLFRHTLNKIEIVDNPTIHEMAKDIVL